ncbi:hypothetical protein ACFL4H_01005 [Candidatus Neomarinimicrobiota bacterium]
MKEVITRKHVVLFFGFLSFVIISNCSSDQNMIGYTDSKKLPRTKTIAKNITTEVLVQDIEEIEIQVSPNILNLASNGVVVTIHTDIEYWTVDVSTVTLNDIDIQSWKADDRGFFVAKFEMDAVKNIVTVGINRLTLKLALNGTVDLLSGSQEILVIEKSGKS